MERGALRGVVMVRVWLCAGDMAASGDEAQAAAASPPRGEAAPKDSAPLNSTHEGGEQAQGLDGLVVEDVSLSGLVVAANPRDGTAVVALPAHPVRGMLRCSFGAPLSASGERRVLACPAACAARFAVRFDAESGSIGAGPDPQAGAAPPWQHARPVCLIEHPLDNAFVRRLTGTVGFQREACERFGDVLLVVVAAATGRGQGWRPIQLFNERQQQQQHSGTGQHGPHAQTQEQQQQQRHKLANNSSTIPTRAPAFAPPPLWACRAPCRGLPVHVVASPFGGFCPDVFANCVTQGLIAAVFPPTALFFTDARCLPGAAGGAILAQLGGDGGGGGGGGEHGSCSCCGSSAQLFSSCLCRSATLPPNPISSPPPRPLTLVGMVLGELPRADGTTTELGLGLGVGALADAVAAALEHSAALPALQGQHSLCCCRRRHGGGRATTTKGRGSAGAADWAPPGCTLADVRDDGVACPALPAPPATPLSLAAVVARSVASVVLVAAGSMWATGAIVDLARGLVVTNAHVVGTAPAGFPLRVRRDGPDGRWLAASVCFVADEIPDIAVLHVEVLAREGGLAAAPLARSDEHLHGTTVFSLGFPLFRPDVSTTAICALGTATAVHTEGQPVMLHTTALAHPGSSGSPLFHAHTGCLVGIVTSFAKHQTAEGRWVNHTRLAYSVPVAALGPLWRMLGLAPVRHTSTPIDLHRHPENGHVGVESMTAAAVAEGGGRADAAAARPTNEVNGEGPVAAIAWAALDRHVGLGPAAQRLWRLQLCEADQRFFSKL